MRHKEEMLQRTRRYRDADIGDRERTPLRGSRWLNSGSGEFFATRNSLEPSALPSTTLPSKTTPVSEGGRRYSRCVRACATRSKRTRDVSPQRVYSPRICAPLFISPRINRRRNSYENFPSRTAFISTSTYRGLTITSFSVGFVREAS